MTYLHTRIALPLIFAASSGLADGPLWTIDGLDMPESAVVDAAQGRIVVSLIGGHPQEADGNGALALLSEDGALIDPAWITGLDAPKGMAILGDRLLVADLGRLHEIDLAAGTLTRSLEVPGAVFLNDVTAGGEQAFVSDMMTDSIWRYSDGALSLWLQDDALSHPNGLLLEGDRLLVGSWGTGMQADFTTETPGALLAVDLSSKEITVQAAEVGNIDGIVRVGDSLLLNDWVTGELFEIGAAGTARSIARHAPGLADISAHGDMLLLPAMLEGTLSAQRFP